jgi:seryl-tRNA synthetase
MKNDVSIEAIGVFTFSKDIRNFDKDLNDIIKKANQTILKKGVPKDSKNEGANVVDFIINGDKLKLCIKSGLYVRAYSAILRMKKFLASELGKKFKIGIRKVIVKKISLKISMEKGTPQNFIYEIRSSSYVKSANKEDQTLIIILDEIKENDLKKNVPDRIINEIIKKIEKFNISTKLKERQKDLSASFEVVKKEVQPIVRKSDPKRIKFSKDPMGEALKNGWIKEFPGRGQWIYTTPYSQLFDIIKEILLSEIAKKLRFQPFMLPKVIPLEVMKKMPGYLEDIPEGMYYIFPPPRDPNAFKVFKEKVKVTKEIPREELKKVLKNPDYVLAPAQCEAFWQFYGGEILDIEQLPYKLYDCSGYTYRWEGGGVEGMVRLQEFQRIELTYLGNPEQVVKIRDEIVDECVRVVDNILDMEWRITAAIPFWAKEGTIDFDPQDSKNIAAYDLEIYLPHRGDRENSEWLEIAGCFVHKLKFVNSFKIKEMKNREIWTGCTGLGITRWIAAFLSTHGFEVENWPKIVKVKFDKNYKRIKTLNWPPKKID